jgi:excisionase family DNA binding protein
VATTTKAEDRPATYPPDHVHDLASAAARLGVGPDTIREWIERGELRAASVGRIGKDRRKHYRIKDAWLMEALERRAEATARAGFGVDAPEAAPKRKGRGAKVAPLCGMDINDPIGPI